MKINIILVAAFWAAIGGAVICSAQTAGGYREISVSDENVIAAAKLAAATQGKTQKAALALLAVERAEKQIVAGANYRMCLSVETNGESRQATAIVYHNLQNQFKLSSWTNGDCAAAGARGKSNSAEKPGLANETFKGGLLVAPETVVKNLYAAQKGENGPFFQTKSRALVDKYFTKDFADVIWQDAVEANGEVGALGFDPLYNAQDTQITQFKIAKPMYGEGNLDVADVPVTFKNMGKSETILFRLERDARKTWKISDIYYPNAVSEEHDSLRKIYKISAESSEGDAVSGELQTGKIESVILYFGEESGDYAAYCFLNDSEVGRAILAACKNGEQCEVAGEINGEAACKVPGLEADLSASGKIIKVNSVKSLGRRKN